jgi:hypothetical protein
MSEDEPRLLASHSELGYTPSAFQALSCEPEAVSEEEQEQLSIEARLRFAELRRDQEFTKRSHQVT